MKDKRKITLTIIGVSIILLLLLGTTYAYYMLTEKNESETTTGQVTASSPGLATLEPGVSNLRLTVGAVEMDEYYSDYNEYYATSDESKKYETDITAGTQTIGTVTIKDVAEDITYDCKSNITVELNGSMLKEIQEGDLFLHLEAGNLNEDIDLYTLKDTNGTSEPYVSNIKITGPSSSDLKAYVKLVNKWDYKQDYLKDTELKIIIKVTNLSCNVKIIKNLAKVCQGNTMLECITNKENEISTVTNMSSEKLGNMYRYQGDKSDNPNNYICFGTTDSNTCINDIDKYMYRIIGLNSEGQIELLKETNVKEGENANFSWGVYGDIGDVSDSCGDSCPEWNDTILFKRINGISNGSIEGNGNYHNNANTDIFVDNPYYDYLKSGDENGTNDEKGSKWYQLISNHDWKYGDVDSKILEKENIDEIYNIEEAGLTK